MKKRSRCPILPGALLHVQNLTNCINNSLNTSSDKSLRAVIAGARKLFLPNLTDTSNINSCPARVGNTRKSINFSMNRKVRVITCPSVKHLTVTPLVNTQRNRLTSLHNNSTMTVSNFTRTSHLNRKVKKRTLLVRQDTTLGELNYSTL